MPPPSGQIGLIFTIEKTFKNIYTVSFSKYRFSQTLKDFLFLDIPVNVRVYSPCVHVCLYTQCPRVCVFVRKSTGVCVGTGKSMGVQ